MKPLLILILSLGFSLSAIGQENSKLRKEILGFWMPEGEPEGVHIEKDSIYYVTYFKSYKYTLSNQDTLMIYFDGGYVYKSKISYRNDTLFFYDREGEYFTRSK